MKTGLTGLTGWIKSSFSGGARGKILFILYILSKMLRHKNMRICEGRGWWLVASGQPRFPGKARL